MTVQEAFWTLYFTAYQGIDKLPMQEQEGAYGPWMFLDSIRTDESYESPIWGAGSRHPFVVAWAEIDLKLDKGDGDERSLENARLWDETYEQARPFMAVEKTVTEAYKAGRWMLEFYESQFGFTLGDFDVILPFDLWEKWAEKIMDIPVSNFRDWKFLKEFQEKIVKEEA